MKLNIALIENLNDEFYYWARDNSHNVYNLSSYFKKYKNLNNYKFLKNPDQIFDSIKNEILLDFGNNFFSSIDIVIFRTNVIIDKNIIDLFKNSKLFIRAGSGYDNIDIKYLYSKKIIGQNTPKANYIAAAEHTLSLTLSLIKKIKFFDDHIRGGNWRGNSSLNIELSGKNVLIIGFGWVGKEVCKLFSSYSTNIYVYDPYMNEKEKDIYSEYTNLIYKLKHNYSKKFSNFKNKNPSFLINPNLLLPEFKIGFINNFEKLKNILNTIDIISLHVPLTDETYKFLNYDFLENIKEDSFIINTSRGEIIDETSLINLLSEEKLKGYASDVFDSEPVFYSDLFKFKYNTIFSPHIGSYTFEAKERITNEVIDVIDNFVFNDLVLYPFNEKFYFSKYFK
ncbi:MAG: hypothetical protein N3A58_01935 [Spirochaetes bacterium]|nr:hypothetical protein [Spirochaetota bacterium]